MTDKVYFTFHVIIKTKNVAPYFMEIAEGYFIVGFWKQGFSFRGFSPQSSNLATAVPNLEMWQREGDSSVQFALLNFKNIGQELRPCMAKKLIISPWENWLFFPLTP